MCRDNSLDRDKIRFALEMNIPAVRADWLWDSMKSFRKMPLEDYLIYPSRQGQNAPKRRLRGGSNITTSCETIKESFKPNSKQFESELSNGSLIVEKGQDDITQDVSPVVDDSFSLAEQPELPSLDTLINPLAPDTSSHTSQGNGPLKERSPNSPSKQPTPPLAKASRSPSPSSENTQKTTISEALSSLIAHHSSRAESFNAPSKDSASNANSGKSGDNRRSKRKLFSRVASNLSAKSSHNLSVNVSRASSVDTLNTDGLGSPIDLQPPQPNRSMDITEHLSTAALNGSSTTKGNAMNRLAESLFDPAPYNLDFPEEQVAPPMTQVGYEDPEAKIYRAKLVKKMSGRKKEAKSPEVKVDPEQKLVDSVGKRTRGRPSRA